MGSRTNSKRVVIVGAGGHGREVAEILLNQRACGGGPEVLGFIDDNRSLHGSQLDNLPVLGDWSWFDQNDHHGTGVICAVGTPAVCKKLVGRARQFGCDFVNAISPRAHISPLATIEEGVTIFPGVVVNTGSHIGSHSILNLACTVSHDSKIGPYCNVNPGVHLAGNVTIGEGCYIGMGANVIQGRNVGAWTIVGAGSVIIRDLPSRVTAVGVPARSIKAVESE